MPESKLIETMNVKVDGAAIHAERYPTFVAVTFWGDYSWSQFVGVGDALLQPWSIVRNSITKRPSLWGIVRRSGAPDDFRRYDSSIASLTYMDGDTPEVGVITEDASNVVTASERLTGDVPPAKITMLLMRHWSDT